MDCEACTEAMIDLLFEETDAPESKRLRAHMDECAECSEAFERLSVGQAFANRMEMVDPPPGLLDGVLAAARDKVADRAPSAREARSVVTTPAREALPEDEGLWAVVLKWVGGVAMRPQMAMAMTLVLMVGIGLWYLPELRRSDPADSQAIVDPSPVGEVGPSASLAPAEPLDLHTDPRTGRILPRGPDEAPVRPRRRPTPSEAPSESAQQAVATIEGAAEPDVNAEDATRSPEDDNAPELATLEPASPPAIPPGMGEVNLDEGQALALAPRAPAAPRPSAAPPGEMMGTRVAPTREQGGAPTGMAMDDSPAAPASAPAMAQAERTESEMVARPPAQGTTLPTALHRQARNQRGANDCRSAVASYERLLSAHPRYPQAGQARLEAGDCYRRLGRIADARRMFERASRIPSVASAARRELSRLDASDRAPAVESASEAY